MSQKKKFLLERIDDYRAKISLTEKNSPVMKDAKHKQSPKSRQLERIDHLKQSFISNNAGQTINGRYLPQPIFQMRRSSSEREDVSLSPVKFEEILQNVLQQTQQSAEKSHNTLNNSLALNSLQNASTTSRTIDVGANLHNLFINYKIKDQDIKRRSLSTMDYEGIKNSKVLLLTKDLKL